MTIGNASLTIINNSPNVFSISPTVPLATTGSQIANYTNITNATASLLSGTNAFTGANSYSALAL
jgi:hypothetical protein